MVRKLVSSTLLMVVVVASAGLAVAHGQGEVFLDEGDGDFEVLPNLVREKHQASETASSQSKMQLKIKTKTKTSGSDTEPAKSQVRAPAKSRAERVPASVGIYLSTRGPCPMHREPVEGSEQMLIVRAQKRIWVEEVDSSWVRAFNKAGDPGYVRRDCLK